MKYYFAYGQNTDSNIMRFRAPESRTMGLAYIKGYKLHFNGHATIVQNQNEKCYGVLWFISSKDEDVLDIVEGVPSLYRKITLPVYTDGAVQNALIYQMQSNAISKPHLFDLNIVFKFRKNHNLDYSDLIQYTQRKTKGWD